MMQCDTNDNNTSENSVIRNDAETTECKMEQQMHGIHKEKLWNDNADAS